MEIEDLVAEVGVEVDVFGEQRAGRAERVSVGYWSDRCSWDSLIVRLAVGLSRDALVHFPGKLIEDVGANLRGEAE